MIVLYFWAIAIVLSLLPPSTTMISVAGGFRMLKQRSDRAKQSASLSVGMIMEADFGSSSFEFNSFILNP